MVVGGLDGRAECLNPARRVSVHFFQIARVHVRVRREMSSRGGEFHGQKDY